MTTMIERVARAICLSQTQSERVWQSFFPEARAAIEAMREPTEAMRAAVREVGGIQAVAYANAAWPTMIDAALSEEEI